MYTSKLERHTIRLPILLLFLSMSRLRPPWRQVKGWKRRLLAHVEEGEFATLNSAYNLYTAKSYRGRNVSRLYNAIRQKDLSAAIFLTGKQANLLGGTIPNQDDETRVIFLKDMSQPGRRDIFIRRYGVFHYGDAVGLDMTKVQKRLSKIREMERLVHLGRAVLTLKRHVPTAPVPMHGDMPSDYFFRQLVDKDKPFHAIVSSLELCQEARVSFTWPQQQRAQVCKVKLQEKASTNYLRSQLKHWRLIPE